MKTSKIKSAIKMVPWVMGTLLLIAIQTSCSKQNELKQPPQASALANSNLPLAVLATDSGLIAYKNSPHLLMMGYYRTWGDYYVAYKAGNPKMTDMPDSVDILSVFADYTPDSSQYWVQLKNNYIPTLHSKGTKVIVTTGSYPSATDTATVNTWARGIINSVNNYNYDGVDLDLETSNGSLPSAAIVARQKAGLDALSKYLGPKSGTNKLLIYDTNTDGGGSSGLVAGVKDEINYVFLQAYWRTTSSLTSTLGTYTPYIPKSKLLVGVDFEDGTGEQPGQMPAYTQWAIQNQTGGVFSYGIDNEYFQVSGSLHNIYTRAAIQAMNPAGGGGTTTGVQFYQDANYGGAATQLIPKGSYTMANFATYGMNNDWASSVKIPTGWTVIIYSDNNFSGQSWTLTSNNSWLGGLSPSANDVVSSFKIQ